jgi:hypothetical protein
MGGVKDVVVAILAIAGGLGLGYFWTTNRPEDSIEIVAGITVAGIALIYFALISMGKH